MSVDLSTDRSTSLASVVQQETEFSFLAGKSVSGSSGPGDLERRS